MVEGMDSGSGAGMTRVTLSRQWKGPGMSPPVLALWKLPAYDIGPTRASIG